MQADEDSAHVKIPPPLLLLSILIIGGFIQWMYPVSIVSESLRWPIGIILIVAGIGTILYSAWLFRKAQTRIEPWKTTSHIIKTNIYSLSRNPIYFAFLIIGLGVAFMANSLWIVLSLIPLIFLLNTLVIQKEERYLEKKFGQEYLEYKAQVRRWI
jgi:protein-S-isoprenylcysteine O-methyltransferase Ste14